MLRFRRLGARATPPVRKTVGAAGYDLSCVEDVTVPSGARCAVSTLIAIEVPQGHVGILKSRSSLAAKGLDVAAGVIDADYRGEVIVLLHNASSAPVSVDAGARIAQLVILPMFTGATQEVTELTETVRAEGGFGSTGV